MPRKRSLEGDKEFSRTGVCYDFNISTSANLFLNKTYKKVSNFREVCTVYNNINNITHF